MTCPKLRHFNQPKFYECFNRKLRGVGDYQDKWLQPTPGRLSHFPWPAITFQNIGYRICHIAGNISQNCWTQPILHSTLVEVETSWTLKLVNIKDYLNNWQQLTLGTYTYWPVIRFHNSRCKNTTNCWPQVPSDQTPEEL